MLSKIECKFVTMVNTSNNYLHAKILSGLLTSFFVFFPNHLAFADNSKYPYIPEEQILLACGSSDSFVSLDGRSWLPDINSQNFTIFEPPNKSSISSSVSEQSTSSSEKYYLKARLSCSPFTYIFNVTAGQKFIRLYFYPNSYQVFDSSKAFFSVEAGSFTLLSNFSAWLTVKADAYHRDTFFKEYCVNVEEGQRLNITFIPSPDAYAFINGIEIISIYPNLYYTADGKQFHWLGGEENLSNGIRNKTALEMVYRINVGGAAISPQYDTGMYRTWSSYYTDYLTDARSGALAFNASTHLSFKIPNATAPAVVYRTAMSMGIDRKLNEINNLTWEFPVDCAFTYFVRLHFCEIQIEISEVGDRVFEIFIANQTAESKADVIAWSGGNGVPTYRDYAVKIGSEGNQKKQNLSIALHPAPPEETKYSDVLLNGLEIFKVDKYTNLAGPNPDSLISPPSVVPPSPNSRKPKINPATRIPIICGVVSGFVVLSIVILFILRSRWKVKDSVSGDGVSMGPFSSAKIKSSKSRGSSQPSDLCTHFPLSEINAATNNFDDILIIGVGGFGNVYKGWLISNDATPVAIKRLNPGSQQGALEFKTEIEMLSQLRHRHLVSLIGYCDDDGEMILVYDYMARGTVRDHLYYKDNPPLQWSQRLQICIGAARGLNYLHTGAKHTIIHRDVKTTNILLDERWTAKVSDFGLSKIGPTTMSQSHVSTMVKGTFGYLDPDYFLLQELTEKSDVYSFGVVLFEVLCARPPVLRTMDRKRASLAVWAQECHNNGTFDQIVDPFLKGKIETECLKKFEEVALSCLHEERNKRPSMSEVVYGLEFALRLQKSMEKDEEFREAHIDPHLLDKEKMPLENYTRTDNSGLAFTDYLEY